jgi:Flp pilus assembly protein TadD
VETLRKGNTQWVKTTTGQTLEPGDFLRTGRNSRAGIKWPDEITFRLGADTLVEILPPAESGLRILQGLLSFFHREKPGRIRILTRGSMAGVKGTELVMKVEFQDNIERTALFLIDGLVELSNDQDTVLLTNGEQGIAETGKPPRKTAGFIVNNVLQWAFYYPAVLDLNDLRLTVEEQQDLADSMAAYQAGDLLAALDRYPTAREPASEAEVIYHVALRLSVGQAEGAQAAIDRILDRISSENVQRPARALRQLIAAVKHETSAPAADPRLATEFLAASYYEQSRAEPDSLKMALELARRATAASPKFGFAWARVAELEFSFGRTHAALEALNRSLVLSPRNAQALALRGFLLAAENTTREAVESFNDAIAVDSALANAWLGRGLCRIRRGDTSGGREDLLIAAALEPQRSLLRSYLGKAYTDAGQSDRAAHELVLARQLDPADPTPWLYSALRNRERNAINESIADLERSQQLNDNRRLFRSALLLDQDRAVRSVSLASIYRDAGMTEVSLREAATAVTADYANHSAHLFLANSYDALRDPTRFNLRYETPWFNELLLANLLAPAGVQAISPNISQQEYFRLFERDRFGIANTTELRSDGQYRDIVSQFGSLGPLSYSLDLDWQRNEGVRPNNELTRIEWYSQIKWQVTQRDSLFALIKYQDYHSGDNFQLFDPQAYRPDFNFDEYQQPLAVGAYHREWSPGIHTLILGGRLTSDARINDELVGLPVFTRSNTPQREITSITSTDFDVKYRSEFEIGIGELNQIFQTDRHTLVLGGRFQAGQFDTRNFLTNRFLPAFFPNVTDRIEENFERWTVYGYDTVEPLRNLWVTAGISYDALTYPDNYRQVPISEGQKRSDLLAPKAAVVWSPAVSESGSWNLLSGITVRSAYSQSLGGVSFDESFRLEPPQLAGFNQSYRTVISESVVGSVSAPTFEIYGAALDLKFKSGTYVGFWGEAINSDVDRVLGVYDYVNPGPGVPSSSGEELGYEERSAGVTVNQLLFNSWAMGATYKFTRSELDRRLPEVPTSILGSADRTDRADLHQVNVYLLYQHASGIFARADANWYKQDNFMTTKNAAGDDTETDLFGDDFWQFDFWIGYRLRRNIGDISLGLLNLTDTDYKLNPLNSYLELPRERVVAGRVRLRF